DTVSSASYGFTAGASYRNNGVGVTGNMVFGGYDRARLVQGNSVSIPMPNKQNNTLLVGVQSITYNANPDVEPGSASFTSGGFNAIIDSTLPYLILPKDICDKFVQKFNLDYDSTNNLYTINNTAHERNTQQNATVSFKIGYGSANSATYSTIKFPYEAFYLDASSPFTQNAKKYFPIRKSTNGLHILGRTFLQEAYIYVDYERANFTVAQAFFSDPMPNEDLVSIYDTTYERPPRSSSDPEDSGLSSGTIAGIVIGIVAVFLIIGACAFFYYRRRRNSKVKALEQEEKPPGVDTIDTIAAGSEIKHRRVSELTGSELPYSAQPKPVGYYGGDHKSIPELSPHSPPSELYSPPLEDENGSDYFTGPKPRRRGATRDSSGNNTPGTPVAELAGDDACYQVSGEQPNAIVTLQRPNHNRGPSDNSLSTNIDEVLAGPDKDTAQVERKHSSRFVEHTDDVGLSRAEMVVSPLENTRHDECDVSTEPTTLRRPSHTRGLSDTTVNSESTAVSQPTPEELLRWAGNSDAIRPD
ncbi:aspartic peptidase domain-containing protein, partial [Phaeosphaeriaceae sp. PMI808]